MTPKRRRDAYYAMVSSAAARAMGLRNPPIKNSMRMDLKERNCTGRARGFRTRFIGDFTLRSFVQK
jgi:hypothetical protein